MCARWWWSKACVLCFGAFALLDVRCLLTCSIPRARCDGNVSMFRLRCYLDVLFCFRGGGVVDMFLLELVRPCFFASTCFSIVVTGMVCRHVHDAFASSQRNIRIVLSVVVCAGGCFLKFGTFCNVRDVSHALVVLLRSCVCIIFDCAYLGLETHAIQVSIANIEQCNLQHVVCSFFAVCFLLIDCPFDLKKVTVLS